MHPLHRIARATIVAVGLFLLLAPTAARAAQGLNLAWDRCLGEGSGVQNANFACNTNSGSHVMVGSFVLANDFPDVIGTEVVLELASASAALPAWWQFHSGTCRQSTLAIHLQPNPADVVCVDWSDLQAAGGFAAYCTAQFQCISAPSANNVAILKLVGAVPPASAQDLTAGVEYFDFNVLIPHAKTVGIGSCAGCDVPVCLVLNSINVVALDNVEQRFLATPTGPGTNFVTWQGGGVPVTPRGTGCPAATPSRRSTWGSVKSLYR